MGNEAQYRDLSVSNPFLPGFSESIVVRIDRVSIATAFVAGLFGILYFSLAPAAMVSSSDSSSVLLGGYNCKMLSAVSRSENIFSRGDVVGQYSLNDSVVLVTDYNSRLNDAVKEIPLVIPYLSIFPYFLLEVGSSAGSDSLDYQNARFDTHNDCLVAAQSQTSCKFETESFDGNFGKSVCYSVISCSSLNGKVRYKKNGREYGVYTNISLLANPAFGRCSNQANIQACKAINENCEGLRRVLAMFTDLTTKLILKPELICRPFLDNPPYLCKKTEAPSVPSILSQSLAFTTTALALAKTVFFAVKMRNKHTVSKGDDDAPGTHDEGNTPKTVCDSSIEMQSMRKILDKKSFDRELNSRFELIEFQIKDQSRLLQVAKAESEARFENIETELGLNSALRMPLNAQSLTAARLNQNDATSGNPVQMHQRKEVVALAPVKSRAQSAVPPAQRGSSKAQSLQAI
jgi:hypothetical protein